MLIAVVLAILVIASVAFHFLNPWQATPLASNWGNIDSTLAITFLVCGIFFVLVMAFMIYCLVKFRHREGHRAHYEPENKKLEVILSVATSIGICAMLAPGLIAYDKFIHPPENAMPVEVLARQWNWQFRFPGTDGVLGKTSIQYFSASNPFGINPNDPNGQDDILVQSNQLHLPIDQPVTFVLRSIDVLHNFYIPQFRAKMDMIPGVVTSFWATPTKLGKYEILCAELCGTGHFTMRGKLQVETLIDYNQWLNEQPSFAQLLSGNNPTGLVEQGRQLAKNNGCQACHSIDGSKGLAPTWLDLYGKTEILSDGSTINVNKSYFNESILTPNTQIVQGYPPVMAAYDFNNDQLDALLAYTRSLTSTSPVATESTETTDSQARGRSLAQSQGCVACHTVDGSPGVGPGWQGLSNSIRQFADGSSQMADISYLKESVLQPNAKIVTGYSPMMPSYTLTEAQLNDLATYIHSLSDIPPQKTGSDR